MPRNFKDGERAFFCASVFRATSRSRALSVVMASSGRPMSAAAYAAAMIRKRAESGSITTRSCWNCRASALRSASPRRECSIQRCVKPSMITPRMFSGRYGSARTCLHHFSASASTARSRFALALGLMGAVSGDVMNFLQWSSASTFCSAAPKHASASAATMRTILCSLMVLNSILVNAIAQPVECLEFTIALKKVQLRKGTKVSTCSVNPMRLPQCPDRPRKASLNPFANRCRMSLPILLLE